MCKPEEGMLESTVMFKYTLSLTFAQAQVYDYTNIELSHPALCIQWISHVEGKQNIFLIWAVVSMYFVTVLEYYF